MIIKYKTRNMSAPKGKPKVFFSCHPDDFNDAFPLISEDILDVSNCAIWYDSSLAGLQEFLTGTVPEGTDVTLEDALQEMQLIVLAVTSKFLHSNNDTKDRVLPFALQNHIPVLPVMLENGLKSDFNNTCAKIQVVERYVTDPTASSYEDVLKTFLYSVLVSEELAEKVRAAFDAYIFLSYRKKDRRYAHRLMRLIHENEQFRDIAIWYDEYLVPGESFNKAIEEAFKKSSLFAMAVTPHLEEKGNYVMRVEYPMARDRKKTEDDFGIVPVEMYEQNNKEGEGTDWRIDFSNLKGKEFQYDEIPDLKDEHRPVEMNRSFIDALEKIAKKENDGSAQHRFLIGLAYLNGIDVEINPKRAVELFSGAAEDPEPCMDATAKMADMYLNGEGVKRDQEQAVIWQQKLASQYRTAYEANHDPDEHKGYGTAYFKALRKLSEMHRDAGRIEDAMAVAEQALEFSDKLEGEVGVREQERDKALMLNQLGELYCELWDFDSAEDLYEKACRIYERQASEIGTHRARRDLSISYERLGDVCRRKGNLPAADEYYGKACAIREHLNEVKQTTGSRRDLSSVLTKQGNIRKCAGEYAEAEKYYSRALDFDRSLALEIKTAQAWDDCGVSLVKLGDIYKAIGKRKEAESLYTEAYSIFQRNAKNTGSPIIQDHLAGGSEKLAGIKKKLGRTKEAECLYMEAVRLRQKQCDSAKTASSVHALAAAYYNAAVFLEDREMMRNAYDLWNELSRRHPEYTEYRDKAGKWI